MLAPRNSLYQWVKTVQFWTNRPLLRDNPLSPLRTVHFGPDSPFSLFLTSKFNPVEFPKIFVVLECYNYKQMQWFLSKIVWENFTNKVPGKFLLTSGKFLQTSGKFSLTSGKVLLTSGKSLLTSGKPSVLAKSYRSIVCLHRYSLLYWYQQIMNQELN